MEVSGEVANAVIGAFAAIVVALIGALGSVIHRNARATRDAVGTPNGQGNLIEMAERILAGQAAQDNRIARLESGHHGLRSDHERLAGRVDALERRS